MPHPRISEPDCLPKQHISFGLLNIWNIWKGHQTLLKQYIAYRLLNILKGHLTLLNKYVPYVQSPYMASHTLSSTQSINKLQHSAG